MRRVVKVALAVLAIPVAFFVYFAPNVHGYYRFKQMCEAEGGLRIYHKLQKGVPWQADPLTKYSAAAHQDLVQFVRVEEEGQLRDMRRLGPKGNRDSYQTVPANVSLAPVYEVRLTLQRPPGEVRLNRASYEIREVDTGRLMVRWYEFGYSLFDQDRTLLAAPSNVVCHDSQAVFSESLFVTFFEN